MFANRAFDHFLAAFEHGNLGAAARAIGVTQPAISKSVAKLEATTGVALFERSAHGIAPTRHGALLYEHASRLRNELRAARTGLAALTAGRSGELVIGIGPAWSLSVAPPLLALLRQLYPGIAIDARIGVRDALLPELEAGQIDVWLGSVFGLSQIEGLATEPILRAQMSAFVRRGDPLTDGGPHDAAALAGRDWAGFHDDVVGFSELARFFANAGAPPPRVAMRSSSIATLFAAAASTDLIVYASDTLAGPAAQAGLAEIEVTPALWAFDTGIAYQASVKGMAPVATMREALRSLA